MKTVQEPYRSAILKEVVVVNKKLELLRKECRSLPEYDIDRIESLCSSIGQVWGDCVRRWLHEDRIEDASRRLLPILTSISIQMDVKNHDEVTMSCVEMAMECCEAIADALDRRAEIMEKRGENEKS